MIDAGRHPHALRGIGLTGQLAVDGVQALTNAALGLFHTLEGVFRLTPPGWLFSLMDGGSAGGAFGSAGDAFDAATAAGAETRFNLFGTPIPGGSTAPAGLRSPDRRGSGVRGGGKRWADSVTAATSDDGLERRLSGFLENPTAVVPGTTMTYAGVKDAGERRDLIAWLRHAGRTKALCP